MKFRSFSDFITEDVKEISFVFGRFNPPTAGHEKLFDALKKNSNGQFRIYASQSQDPKKNPLSHKDKVKFMRKMFPKYARNIVADRDVKNALEILVKLYDQGFTKVNMVVGSDRLKEFDRLLNRYNGEKARHGFYQFQDGIKVISAGERDPDAEGVAGMSASKLRKAAEEDDLVSFSKGMPSGYKEAKDLFNAVRLGMGLKESVQRPHVQLEKVSDVREAYVEGELFNEGDLVIVNETKEEATIVRTCSNYLMLEFANGERKRAWLDSVSLVENTDKELTKQELDTIEKFADKLFAKVGIDVEFTRHFLDRVNDERNKKQITQSELIRLFKQAHKKHGKTIAKMGPDAQAVLNDIKTDINMPFVLVWDGKELDMVAKTVMRKKNFGTSNPKLKVESLEMGTAKIVSQYKKMTPGEIEEVSQDKDVEDLPGSQPSVYFKGVDKDKKKARDAHFKRGAKKDDDDPSAYKPAPGDKDAKTKPSKHTKKFKDMFGESLEEDLVGTGGRDWLTDKVREIIARLPVNKKYKRAVRFYLDLRRKTSGDVDNAQKSMKKAARITNVDYRTLNKIFHDMIKNGDLPKHLAFEDTINNNGDLVNESSDLSEDTKKALQNKADKTGIPYSILKKVFDRGVAAWRTGHRPGTTATQWGLARVNSFATKGKGTWGKADKDLADKVRASKK
jgi:hypothetical protein